MDFNIQFRTDNTWQDILLPEAVSTLEDIGFTFQEQPSENVTVTIDNGVAELEIVVTGDYNYVLPVSKLGNMRIRATCSQNLRLDMNANVIWV